MLFECFLVFFLFDNSNSDSFKIIKELTNIINKEKFPDLPIILIQNKKDNIDVTEFEINEYLELNPSIMKIDLPLKDKNELFYKLIEINDEFSNTKKLYFYFSNDIIEAKDNKMSLINIISMSFILVGDTKVGKTSFFNRYQKNHINLIILP